MGKEEAQDFFRKEIRKMIEGIDDAIYLRRIYVIIKTHTEESAKK